MLFVAGVSFFAKNGSDLYYGAQCQSALYDFNGIFLDRTAQLRYRWQGYLSIPTYQEVTLWKLY